MLALAGYPLGLRFVFLDKSEDAPGAQVGKIITGEFGDPDKLAQLAGAVDMITYDVENVPLAPLRAALDDKPFWPPLGALETAQDRLFEKTLFRELDIPTPPFMKVDSQAELERAVVKIGLPAVLKTRRLGYDGKGQRMLRGAADVEGAFDALGKVPLILEGFVAFEREISVIGVRNNSGEVKFYPIAENAHRDGILRYSIAPYENAGLQAKAEAHARRLLEHFAYAGVLTIEFFVKDGLLVANEIAPRVHNSGHWTIEGAATSQFENHIRAILDLPLGDINALGRWAMVNFIGKMPRVEDVLAVPGAHYHSYGKTPRPGRKLGHATLNAADERTLRARLERLLALQ